MRKILAEIHFAVVLVLCIFALAEVHSETFFVSELAAKQCRADAVEPCLKFRGAYALWNGGCPGKITVTATGHMFCLGSDLPEGFVKIIGKTKNQWDHAFAADFEGCPMQKEKPKHEGLLCVLSTSNISVQKRR